jgi:hypothetical protein
MHKNNIKLFILSGIAISFFLVNISFFLQGCTQPQILRTSGPIDSLNTRSIPELPYLKMHTYDGKVYVLNKWDLDRKAKLVSGKGEYLDENREIISKGEFTVPFESVVITETNVISGNSAATGLGTASVITGIFTAVCISDPKACFGSCPTFYAFDGHRNKLQAEGFSSSIAPSLEAKDIDALYNVSLRNRDFNLEVKNEALETHYIRYVNILAAHHSKGNRVLATTQDKFYEVSGFLEPSLAIANEGDIKEKIRLYDGTERFSRSDSVNLAEKETVELTFENVPSEETGLVIACRQSLMTTFVFYQSLAYMGTKAGDWLTRLELGNNNIRKLAQNFIHLGFIEILMQDKNRNWHKISEAGETGPIAGDIKLVPIKRYNVGEKLKLRLVMTKGLWRIDYLSLAIIVGEVKPVEIHPEYAEPQYSGESKVVDLLLNNDSLLINMPGDEYFIHYRLPDNYNEYELFLDTKGYYIEWMRDKWIKEEEPYMVYEMFFNSAKYLKDLAPKFKAVEASMEKSFWSSKYVRQ